MADSSDGQDMSVQNELGMVVNNEGSVTLIDAPCLRGSSIILTEAGQVGGLNVSHYIIPQEVTVRGFEEVVEEVELGPSSWDSITSTSSSASLNQDSGIESDANPDVFFAFIDNGSSPMAYLTPVSHDKNGTVAVQKLFEMKDDFEFAEVEVKNDAESTQKENKCRTSMHPQIVKVIIKDESVTKDLSLSEQKLLFGDHLLQVESSFDPDEDNVELYEVIKEEYLDENATKAKESKSKQENAHMMYHCTECNINFGSHKNFKSHMEEHLTRLQNSCALCNEEFESKSALQDHIKDHFAKSSSSVCEICNKEFVSKTVLKRHKKHVHNSLGHISSTTQKCEICQAVFSSKFSLKSHIASHSSRKPYTCKECGATFTQNGSLQVHLRRHRGEKPFKCIICGNKFTRAHSLKVHMKTHTGEKPYSCEYCGACFVTSSHLTVHRRTHTGERPYSCNECGATFITTSHLNVHRRLHSTNGIYSIVASNKSASCTVCGVTFEDQGKLRHHRRTEHRGLQKGSTVQTIPISKCKDCGKQFSSPIQLRDHVSVGCAIESN